MNDDSFRFPSKQFFNNRRPAFLAAVFSYKKATPECGVAMCFLSVGTLSPFERSNILCVLILCNSRAEHG